MSKLSLAKTANGIRAILDVDIQADWEWYSDAILSFLQMSGYEFEEHFTTEYLNDRIMTDAKILNWLELNTR